MCFAYFFFLEGIWVPEHFLYCLQSLVSIFKKVLCLGSISTAKDAWDIIHSSPPCCVPLPLSLRVHEAACLLPMLTAGQTIWPGVKLPCGNRAEVWLYFSNSPDCFLTDRGLKGNHLLCESMYMKWPVETNP